MYVSSTTQPYNAASTLGASQVAPPLALDQVSRQQARDVHVVRRGNAWTVKLERFAAYGPPMLTQVEAIAYGVRMARAMAVQLVIHGRDGRFRDVWNYGARKTA